LIRHLQDELSRAERDRNRELISELVETLTRVESLSRRFFRWEQSIDRALQADDLREIKKLPLGL